MPTVGVVIPCHNQADTVERAFVSSKGADQIIIVYDEIVTASHFMPAGQVVTTYTPMPAGVTYARNLGIYMLSTDLIIPLDADDYFMPYGIKALVEAWRPGVWVYGDYVQGGDMVKAPEPDMITRKNLAQATFCFSKSDWLKVGGFNARYNAGLEDWAFQLELTNHDIIPHKIHIPVYNYTSGGRRDRYVQSNRWLFDMIEADYGLALTR